MTSNALPNCQNAHVTDTKLYGYLLNLSHPEGKGKAHFYQRIGYTTDNGERLRENLLRLACSGIVTSEIHNLESSKYVVSGSLNAPNGKTYYILTVWAVEPPRYEPRLITAYPND